MFDLSAALHPPRLTAALPATGGQIKGQPEDFIVREIPLYEPCGAGDHIYLTVQRQGATTEWLTRQAAALLGLQSVDVGLAGLKDKHALTTQTLSFHLPKGDPEAVAATLEQALPIQVLSASRHTNKLRRGHLLGNAFQIRVADPVTDALPRCQAIIAALEQSGLPNFYGPQRFGINGDNAERARGLLLAGKKVRPRDRFLLSAYQSALFNLWLCERIARGDFERLLLGDVAKKVDTGGLFIVKELETDQQRLDRRELTYTGPIIGSDLRAAEDHAAAFETPLFKGDGIPADRWKRVRLSGSRRTARLYLKDVRISDDAGALRLDFTLPKGAYATTLLNEVTGQAPTVSADAADDE